MKNKPFDIRVNPEKRICPMFDMTSIKKYEVASNEDMGFRVVDNCAEDHIM